MEITELFKLSSQTNCVGKCLQLASLLCEEVHHTSVLLYGNDNKSVLNEFDEAYCTMHNVIIGMLADSVTQQQYQSHGEEM